MDATKKEYAIAITAVTDYIAAMIRSLPDTTIPLSRSHWTIGTAAAHLVVSQRLSKKILQGEKNPYNSAKPETVAETNAKMLEEFVERKGDKLATMLVMDTESFLKALAQEKDTFTMQTHFGKMDLQTSLAYNLCHLLIHASQIAMALKKTVPVTKKDVEMVLPFLKLGTKASYDKDVAKDFIGTFAVHLRNSVSYAIICEGQSVQTADEIPEHVDCHISADPVSFFLVSTGVITQWKPLFTGKLIAWGRKPWLGLRLTQLFKSP
jgi:uncharacterized damage-inducible protein DinB